MQQPSACFHGTLHFGCNNFFRRKICTNHLSGKRSISTMTSPALSEPTSKPHIEDAAVEMSPSQKSDISIINDPFLDDTISANQDRFLFDPTDIPAYPVPRFFNLTELPDSSLVEFTRKLQDRTAKSKPYCCNFPGCDRLEGFSAESDLDRHKRTRHNIPSSRRPNRNWKCQACQTQCEQKSRNNFRVWLRLDNFRDHCRKSHKNQDLNELVARSELLQPGASIAQYQNGREPPSSSLRRHLLPSLTRSSDTDTSVSSDARNVVSSNISQLGIAHIPFSTDTTDRWFVTDFGLHPLPFPSPDSFDLPQELNSADAAKTIVDRWQTLGLDYQRNLTISEAVSDETLSVMAFYLGNVLEYITYNLLLHVPQNRPRSDIIDILSRNIELSAANTMHHIQTAPILTMWTLFYNHNRYVLN